MGRKMLVLDIDGTLTNSRKEITPETKKAVRGIMEEGHIAVIASGRPTKGIRKAAAELELARYGGFALSYNGARITEMKSGRDIFQKKLERCFVPRICDFAIQRDMGMMTYEGDFAIAGTKVDKYMELETRINDIAIKRPENFGEYVNFDVFKCLLTAEADRAETLEKEMADVFGDTVSVYRSEPFFIEVMPKGVNKAAGIEILLERTGIKREDVVCCGDGFNDLSMIRFAGTGVAMANAREEVKKAADFVTLSNDDDGVAFAIKKFFWI